MLDMTPILNPKASEISSYGESGFVVAGVNYEGAIIVLSEEVHTWQDPALSEASIAAFLSAMESRPEILLIGTGATHQFVSPTIRNAIKSQFGVVLDSMDTGAACRTFNILLSEGRSVAAAFLPV